MPRLRNRSQPGARAQALTVVLCLAGCLACGCAGPGDSRPAESAGAQRGDPGTAASRVSAEGSSSRPGATNGAARSQESAASRPGATRKDRFVRGHLSSRYWLRWTSDETDQDLYETLALDLGDPERHPVTGHFLGRLSWDMDGRDPGSGQFSGLADTYRHSVNGHVYDAHADLHRVPGLALLRAGRQMVQETPEVAFFDGLLLESDPVGGAELQFGVYGGASTHLFESSPDEDWTAGVYAQVRPWRGGRVRLDWMHLEDETLLGRHDDDLFAAGLWQTIGERLQLETQYSRIEDRDRDVRVRAAYVDAGSDLLLESTYYQLLRTQRDLVLELDPFLNSLLEYFPYWQVGVLASKGMWEHLRLQAGVDVRRVTDRDDIGQFNRDYERYFATAGVHDLPIEGLALNVTADWWRSDDQDVRSWSVDLSQKVRDRLTATLGTYYSLYKFDLFLARERDHVRTYYGTLRYDPRKCFTLDCRYELEDNDLDQYQQLRMVATWRF